MTMTKEHELFWIPGFEELNLIAVVMNKKALLKSIICYNITS